MNEDNTQKGELIIYETPKGEVRLEVSLKNETVWLTQEQMAGLFSKERSVITKHIRNIFVEGELDEDTVCAKYAHTAADGKKYQTQFYNLDVIISVGYRVHSKQGTQFRIWATDKLRKYMLHGYVLNEKLLESEERYQSLARALNLLGEKVKLPELVGQERELLTILKDYANSLKILRDYDEGTLTAKGRKKPKIILTPGLAYELVESIRREMIKKKEASRDLFGVQSGNRLDSAVSAIYQTYDGEDLYPSVEEKAANLLYLLVKDHPFLDGNKRLAAIMFIYFLKINDFYYSKNGEPKISESALVSLALLAATSNAREKETIVSIVISILTY